MTRARRHAAWIAHRIGVSLLTLLVLTACVYAALRLVPGSPGQADDSGASARGARLQAGLDRLHADESILAGYAAWVADLARLELGESLAVQPGRRVVDLVSEALPFSLALGSISLLVTIGIALPLGLISALPAAGSSRIGGLSFALSLLHVLPAFWTALALRQWFSEGLGLFPAQGAGPAGVIEASLGQRAPYWVLPPLAVALGSLAFVIRFTRETLLESRREPWTLSARARGAGRWRLTALHALSGSAVPLLSLAGLMAPGLLAGSVLVETIFALPGVGRLFYLGAIQRDHPLILALALLSALATMASHLAADLLARLADPRMAARPGRGEAAG